MNKELTLDLSSQINGLHDEITGHAHSALQKAIEVGRLLAEQKESLEHGEWTLWVGANLKFGRTQTWRYMRIFSERDVLNVSPGKHLSVRDTCAILSRKMEVGEEGASPDGSGPAEGESEPIEVGGGDQRGEEEDEEVPKPAKKTAKKKAKKKATPAKNWVALDEWEALADDEKKTLLAQPGGKKFNEQKGDSIEWARWSWNPVTGCNHGCKYCYARDIAARFYPQGFVPSIIPARLDAPSNTTPKPEQSGWSDVDKMGWKNVFVCSMADLFGKWVPKEWVDEVLSRVRTNPQWNFLFLTKFPIRMAEFEFPDNAWVGASVDTQAAAKRAEKAFSRITAGLTWLSCEPMMERLTFSSLDMFDWVVMGGASASVAHEGDSKTDKAPATPEFRPPFEWISHLHGQATESNCKVYMKTNLLGRVREYPV